MRYAVMRAVGCGLSDGVCSPTASWDRFFKLTMCNYGGFNIQHSVGTATCCPPVVCDYSGDGVSEKVIYNILRLFTPPPHAMHDFLIMLLASDDVSELCFEIDMVQVFQADRDRMTDLFINDLPGSTPCYMD